MSGVIGAPGFTRSGTLAGGASSAGYPIWFPFNVTVSGTWTGTWWVENSPDNVAWANCNVGNVSPFATNGFVVAPNVFQKGLLYRITRSAGTGTLAFTISGQGVSAALGAVV